MNRFVNSIVYIGLAMKYFGLGMIGGICMAEFRYVYILVALLIFTGLCISVIFKSKLDKNFNQLKNENSVQ